MDISNVEMALAGALVVSEALGLTKKIESNSIGQLIIALIRRFVGK